MVDIYNEQNQNAECDPFHLDLSENYRGRQAPKATKATCSPEAVSTTWPVSCEMAIVHPRPSRIFS
jgi:hypothetical protein